MGALEKAKKVVMTSLDLPGEFAFFQAYHKSRGNFGFHIWVSPMLPWSFYVWSAIYYGEAFTWFLISAHCFYFFLLHKKLGLIFAPLQLALGYHAISFSANSHAGLSALGIHIFSWLTQIVGHNAIELAQSPVHETLWQAIVQADFFIFLQILVMDLGFLPELKMESAKIAKEKYGMDTLAPFGMDRGVVKTK